MQTCDFLFPFEVSRPEYHVRNALFSFTVAQKFILNDSLDFKLLVFSGYIEDLFTVMKIMFNTTFFHRNLN